MWILLHGFTGSARSWDAVVAAADLAPEPLTPTLSGHGPDGRSDEAKSFGEELARLASLASRLERPRLLCGYSMGARLALGLLIDYPELFDAALLIGVHPGLEDERARSERRDLDAGRARLLRTAGLAAFVADWEELPLFQSQRELSEEAIRRQRSIRLAQEPEGLARSLELCGLAEMPDYGVAFSSIRVPVTLMAGSRDSKFRAIALELAGRHPQVEAKLVEEAGHNLLLEAPNAVAGALKRVERCAKEASGQ